MSKLTIKVLLNLAVIAVFCPSTAQAYIDPGTGSLILQALAAALVSASIFWRSLRDKVAALLRRSPKNETENDNMGSD